VWGTVPCDAQSIRGRVVDAATGAPVAEAAVSAVAPRGGVAGRGRSGAGGEFALAFRGPGAFRVRVERTGYATATSGEVTVGPAETVEVEVRVSARPLELDPLTVTARRGPQRIAAMEHTGFYEREARGFGRFYRRDFFEKRETRPISDVLDEMPGLRMFRDNRGAVVLVFDRAQATGAFQRAQKGQADFCPPVYYLDGTYLGTANVDQVLLTNRVEAVEVYGSAATVPVEFNSTGSACGVIVLWTRRSP
jgi:hypothetical protein